MFYEFTSFVCFCDSVVIKFYNIFLVIIVSFRIDCIGRVTKGEADIVILEPEEIYVAHRFFHDAFYVVSEVRTQTSKFNILLVIENNDPIIIREKIRIFPKKRIFLLTNINST